MGMLSIRSIVEQLDPSVHYTESYPEKNVVYTESAAAVPDFILQNIYLCQ